MESLKDATHLYEVERRARHAERAGFRITELQISPTQSIPWHKHSVVHDTFYVLEGELDLFLLNPKETIRVAPHEIYSVRAGRPHLVTNPTEASTVFLVLQGGGAYDYISVPEEPDFKS